ncbi:flagellar brake protein [Vampirovibrio sp.]|uniref:flagellar brake protein n=1 Tax=Vampirovibrio sp. TaxID=2717857 RepID=UPI003593A5CC
MSNEWQDALVTGQKVQVTIWDAEDDSIEYTFSSQIDQMGKTMLSLAAPSSGVASIYPLLQPGVVVGVMLEINPTPCIFYPVIASKPTAEGGIFWLKIPENPQIEFVQRRKHVRIPMVIPFVLEYMQADKPISMSARTDDLSGGGMRFTGMRLFPPAQQLRIKLPLAGGPQVLQLKARVVYSVQNSRKKHPEDLYIVACQFQDLEDAQEMALVRECFRHELKLKEQ